MKTEIQINNALKIVNDKFKGCVVLSSVDYQNWFVFNIRPSGSSNDEFYVIPLIAVDKLDGKLIGFNPLQHDPKAYREAVLKDIIKYDY